MRKIKYPNSCGETAERLKKPVDLEVDIKKSDLGEYVRFARVIHRALF